MNHKSAAALVAILMATSSTAAFAQAATSPNDDREAGIKEIIVTAQKRSERLQDVPIAIAAVTAEAATASGVRTSSDLAAIIPGLTVSQTTGAAVVFLRGIGTVGGTVGQENAVATFIDGVYQPSQNAAIFSLNNISRIEVLKGPQGTLYGRNATGGAINIITRTPSEQTAVEAEVGYGNLKTLEGKIYATTGLAEGVAMDIAGYYYNQQDGFGRNLTTGKDVNRRKDVALRSKLHAEVDDKTKATLTVGYGRNSGSFGVSLRAAPTAQTIDGKSGFSGGYYDINSDVDPKTFVRHVDASLRIEHDLGFAQLVSLSGFGDIQHREFADLDLTPLPIVRFDLRSKQRNFTQELQLGSSDDKNFSWVIGLFYFNDNSQYTPFLLSGAAFAPASALTFSPDRQKTNSLAVYGQTTIEVADKTNLTLGGRYTIDKRDFEVQSNVILPDGTAIVASPLTKASKQFNKPTWRLSLDHKFTEDIMAYASYNRGFKSGVFNLASTSTRPVAPETLDAYEAGLKSTLLDRRVQLNVSGFLYNYKNIQLQRVENNAAVLINAAAARIYGADIDLVVQPDEQLSLRAGMELLHARYTSFPNAPVTIPTPFAGNPLVNCAANPAQCDVSGNRMVRAPEFVANLAGDYDVPLGESGNITLSASLAYSSRIYWEPDNRTSESGRALVSAQILWSSPGEKYQFRVWGKNLTNRHYATFGNEQSFGDLLSVAPGRQYGVSAGVRF